MDRSTDELSCKSSKHHTVCSILESLINQIVILHIPFDNSPNTVTDNKIILSGQCTQIVDSLKENSETIRTANLDNGSSLVAFAYDSTDTASLGMENPEEKDCCSQDDIFSPEKETLLHALELSPVKTRSEGKERVHFNSPISVLYEYHVSPVTDDDTQSLGGSNAHDTDDCNASQDTKFEQESKPDEDYLSKSVACRKIEKGESVKEMPLTYANEETHSCNHESVEENSEDLFADDDPQVQKQGENNIESLLQQDDSHKACADETGFNSSEISSDENLLATSHNLNEIDVAKNASVEEAELQSLVSCSHHEVNENYCGKRKLTKDLVNTSAEAKKMRALQEVLDVLNTCKVQNKRKLFKSGDEKSYKMAKLDLEHNKDKTFSPEMLQTIVAEYISCSDEIVLWTQGKTEKPATVLDQKYEVDAFMPGKLPSNTCISESMKKEITLCSDVNADIENHKLPVHVDEVISDDNSGDNVINLEIEDTYVIGSQIKSSEVTCHINEEESMVKEEESERQLFENSDNVYETPKATSVMNISSNQLEFENHSSEHASNLNESDQFGSDKNIGVSLLDENKVVDAKNSGNKIDLNVISQEHNKDKETDTSDFDSEYKKKINSDQESVFSNKDGTQSIEKVTLCEQLDIPESGATGILLDEQRTDNYNNVVEPKFSNCAQVYSAEESSTELEAKADVKEDNINSSAGEMLKDALPLDIKSPSLLNEIIECINNQIVENNHQTSLELTNTEEDNIATDDRTDCETETGDLGSKYYRIDITLKTNDDSGENRSEAEVQVNNEICPNRNIVFDTEKDSSETRDCSNEKYENGIDNNIAGKCLSSKSTVYHGTHVSIRDEISKHMYEDFTEKYDLNEVAHDLKSPNVCEFISASQVLSQSSQGSGSTGFAFELDTVGTSEFVEKQGSQESIKYISSSKHNESDDINMEEMSVNESSGEFMLESDDKLNKENNVVLNGKKHGKCSLIDHKRTLLEFGEEGLTEDIVHECPQSTLVGGIAECHSQEETGMNQGEQLDIDQLDVYIDKAVDQLVPDHHMPTSPEQCPTHTEDESYLYTADSDKKVQLYACDADIHDDSDAPVCSPVEKTAKPRGSCFQWKYTPSHELSPESTVPELPDEDPIVRITLLKSCAKPLRLGLSRRQPVHSLHKIGVRRVDP